MSDEQKDMAAQLYNEADVVKDGVNPDEVKAPEKTDETPAKPDAPAAPEKKPDAPALEGKPPEKVAEPEKKPEPAAVPEKYELRLPEKSSLTSSDVDRVAVYAKERGLSNEQAQEVLNRESDAVAKFIEAEAARLDDVTQKEWVNQIKADKELGGDGFGKNIELAKRVVTKFADEKLIKELEDTGFGNHPELVRMLVRIGKGMAEDSLVLPGARPGKKEVSMEELFYGKQN